MSTNANDELLDQVRLLDRRQVAELVGRAANTLDEWVAAGKFPRPIQAIDGGKKQWRLAQVKDWIARRARIRYRAPTPRGSLLRGKKLHRQRRRAGGDHG